MSEELAKRAVACKGFRWMPGMLVRYGDGQAWYRLADGDGYGLPFRHVPPNPRDAWPDLTDPATLGCLLALVREAVEPNRAPGDWPMVCTYQSAAKKWGVGAWLNARLKSGKATRVLSRRSVGPAWMNESGKATRVLSRRSVGPAWMNESGKATFAALVLPTFETEAEALVAALEAAP